MRENLGLACSIGLGVVSLLGLLPCPVVLAQQWIPVGPAPAIGGQVENVAQSPVAGAIEAVAAHPTNPDILWIGAVNGGVFRTDNATAAEPTWVPLMDDQASLSIGALELDPTDATHDTLVAGIGRTSSYLADGGPGTGLLRSTDGGFSWAPLSKAFEGLNITGVAPRDSTIVVSIADSSFFGSGVYRSTDTGASFVQISNGPELPAARAFDLAGDPTDATRLFTAIGGTGNSGSGGIYRSDDTGATWTKVSIFAQDAALGQVFAEANLAVGRAGPGATTNVFAAICASGRLSGLFRSGDAGANWTSLDLPQTIEQGTAYGIHVGGQCRIHLSLVADPTDHDVVYVGGDRQPANNENGSLGFQFPNSIGASTFGGRLFRVDSSQPPGSQATPITNCLTALAGCGGSARTANDTAPHADSREMVFDANGDLIETDDGGVYRHTDPNGTTGDWESVVGNLAVIEQHDSALDTISNIVLSGNQDNGTTEQDTPAGTVWTTVHRGDGGDVAVAENDPLPGQSTRYVSSQGFGGARRRVYDSNNVLLSSSPLALTPLRGSPAPFFPFTTPIEVNAVDPTRLILGASATYESQDRLDSITLISRATVNGFGKGPIAYGVPGNPDVLYFGSSDLIFIRTAAPPTLPVGSDPDEASADRIAGIVIDPNDADTAFAIDDRQVFSTVNAGTDWIDMTGNLQSLNPGILRSIEYISSGGGDRLVVGATAGVFATTEAVGFVTWNRFGAGLPRVPVYDLEYDAVGDLLLAGLLGRGAWTLSPTPTVLGCPDQVVLTNQTLTGAQTHQATMTATLGPNLVVDGAGFVVRAPRVTIESGTEIGGSVSLGPNPTCP